MACLSSLQFSFYASLTTPIHSEFTLSNVQNNVKLKTLPFFPKWSLNYVLIKINDSKTKMALKGV